MDDFGGPCCAGLVQPAGALPMFRPPISASDLKAVVYLDFDGVLHPQRVYWSPRKGPYLRDPHGHRLFEHAGLLQEVLAPYPATALVLSTSWVLRYGCRGTARRLPRELRDRVIGATFHSRMSRDTFTSMSRGMQVWADVARRTPANWVAIDDDHLQWPAWCRKNLVRSDPEKGLGRTSVYTQLAEALARMGKTAS